MASIGQKLLMALRRRTPVTTFNWRFLLPKQAINIQLHRFVFYRQYASQPRLFAILAAIYGLLRWYLWGAWVSAYEALRRYGSGLHTKHGISWSKQIAGVLRMSLAYSIPPEHYYTTSLYQRPPKQWLDFVYDFQAQSWHSAFMQHKNPAEEANATLLSEKWEFEQQARTAGLACVKTLQQLQPSETLNLADIEALPEVFFCKPSRANQSKGCWLVQRSAARQEKEQNDAGQPYQFRLTNQVSRKVWSGLSLEQFTEFLSAWKESPYLLQHCIQNAPSLSSIIGNNLAIIRCITFADQQSIKAPLAYLEFKHIDHPLLYFAINIDTNTGQCTIIDSWNEKAKQHFLTVQDDLNTWLRPVWPKVLLLCQQAHQLVPETLSVGWDIALPDTGPVIVEGNTHWAMELAQGLNQSALLKTAALQYYMDKMKQIAKPNEWHIGNLRQ